MSFERRNQSSVKTDVDLVHAYTVLPSYEMQRGGKYTVVKTFEVEKDRLHIILTHENPRLTQMLATDLQEFYMQNRTNEFLKVLTSAPLEGNFYAWQNSRDGKWHRVMVHRINWDNDSIDLRLVDSEDYDILENVSLYRHGLLQLEKRFWEHPTKVIPVEFPKVQVKRMKVKRYLDPAPTIIEALEEDQLLQQGQEVIVFWREGPRPESTGDSDDDADIEVTPYSFFSPASVKIFQIRSPNCLIDVIQHLLRVNLLEETCSASDDENHEELVQEGWKFINLLDPGRGRGDGNDGSGSHEEVYNSGTNQDGNDDMMMHDSHNREQNHSDGVGANENEDKTGLSVRENRIFLEADTSEDISGSDLNNDAEGLLCGNVQRSGDDSGE